MLEADIVGYLAAQLSLAAGTIFEGPMPEEPEADPCVAVVHYGSEPSDDFTMGPSLDAPASELERFQVMVRASTRVAGLTQANAIHAKLDNAQGLSLGGRTYFHIVSGGPPAFLRRDGNDRWYYTADYEARKHRG